MIIAYLNQNELKPQTVTAKNKAILHKAIWIDLLLPSKEEEMLIESLLKIDIPPREELQGIETSSRLYKENGTIFMTTNMIAKSDSQEPKCEAVTLIVTDNKLITVRYIEPHAFALFTSHLTKLNNEKHSAIDLIIDLLEAAIDRLADISERIGRSLDDYSQTIFRTQGSDTIKLDYKKLLQDLGSNGDLNAKAWESLASLNRLHVFFAQAISTKLDKETSSRLEALAKDITGLSEQVKFLTSKVNFLLDATLGMVNIEQNNIIKIFSIAAVIFLPPTLIASIYGMNFDIIPGLKWRFGYPLSIVLMLLSGWLPYQFFKMKKWL